MPSRQEEILKGAAADFFGLDSDADEDEVDSAYREISLEVHPDVSDDPDNDKFIAAGTARDILKDDFDFNDAHSVERAIEEMSDYVSVDKGSMSGGPGGISKEDTDYDFQTSSSMDDSEVEELVLSIETEIIYDATRGLFKIEYRQDDFYDDAVEYSRDVEDNFLSYEDYYDAVGHGLQAGITKTNFINALDKIDQRLSDEYNLDIDIHDISEVVASFMLQGGLDMGSSQFFLGMGPFGADDRYSSDDRFGRGVNGMGRGGKFGRDSRFDR